MKAFVKIVPFVDLTLMKIELNLIPRYHFEHSIISFISSNYIRSLALDKMIESNILRNCLAI